MIATSCRWTLSVHRPFLVRRRIQGWTQGAKLPKTPDCLTRRRFGDGRAGRGTGSRDEGGGDMPRSSRSARSPRVLMTKQNAGKCPRKKPGGVADPQLVVAKLGALRKHTVGSNHTVDGFNGSASTARRTFVNKNVRLMLRASRGSCKRNTGVCTHRGRERGTSTSSSAPFWLASSGLASRTRRRREVFINIVDGSGKAGTERGCRLRYAVELTFRTDDSPLSCAS